MEKVFVSSVMRDFAAERIAARKAIESLGLRALMAEDAPASADPSRDALLPFVEQADVVVLILGARYGSRSRVSGLSPTEEEFNHARATNTPVLAFVESNVEREPEQDRFRDRVGGSWEQGAFTGFFTDANDLALEVVKGLNAHRREQAVADAAPAAQQRAIALAAGDRRNSSVSSNSVRVVLVPVGVTRLIDALVLDDSNLADRAAEIVRKHRLVPQSAGIDATANSAGISLAASSPTDWHTARVTLAADGAIVTDLNARAEGSMGGMAISYPRVQAAIASTTAAAQELWTLIPAATQIRQLAAAVCIPDANHHPLTLSGKVGGSMGVPTLPEPLIAPEPPLIVRRADVDADDTNRRLAIYLRQAFADHNAVMP